MKGGVEGAIAYYTQHLQGGDYYIKEEELSPTLWMGNASPHLGLVGEVTKEQFASLAYNLHPETQQKITQRMPRKAESERRTFWDVTISPPKEFSILALMGDDQTRQAFRELHRKAVKIAAEEIEATIGRRLRANGQNSTQTTGEAVIAAVEHETSRPVDGLPDPHLHTHMLFANITRDPESGEFYALDNSHAVPALHMARQAYYSHLVQGIEQLGYKTETREAQKDFHIVGFSDDVRGKFARREAEIQKRAKEKMSKFDFVSQKEALAASAKDSRSAKVELSHEERAKLWREHAGEEGMEHLSDVQAKARAGSVRAARSHSHTRLFESIGFAKETCFEHESVVSMTDFEREVLKAGRGRFTVEEMRAAIGDDKEIIVHGRELTTTAVIDEEKELLAMVSAQCGQHAPRRVEGYEISPSPEGAGWEFSDEQQAAINGILDDTGFVVCLNGVAGAGKTSLLKEVEKGIGAGGGRMATLAPSHAARNILREEGFKEAETLQQWLVNPKLREKLADRDLVIDEAGMVSSRDMVKLCREAEAHGNRVILVGDVKQLSAVQRGEGFRLIQDHTPAVTYQIEKSNRQKPEAYKDVVAAIRRASDRGQWNTAFERMETSGILREITTYDDDGNETSIEAMLAEIARERIGDESRLVVAARWETIHVLNSLVREGLKEAGAIGETDQKRTVLENRNLSPALLEKARFYEPGDIVEINADTTFAPKGSRFRVVQSRGSGKMLEVEDKDGNIRKLPQGKLARENALTLYRERKIDIASGDALLCQSNTGKLANGDKVKIVRLDQDGRMEVEKPDGSRLHLDKDFDKFVHSYAVTAHASQGATVDRVTVVADGMEKKALYVAATRGREECTVYTANSENLKSRLTHNQPTKSGIELIQTTEQRVEADKKRIFPGFRRNLEQLQIKEIMGKTKIFRNLLDRAKARTRGLRLFTQNQEALKRPRTVQAQSIQETKKKAAKVAREIKIPSPGQNQGGGMKI